MVSITLKEELTTCLCYVFGLRTNMQLNYEAQCECFFALRHTIQTKVVTQLLEQGKEEKVKEDKRMADK